MAAAVPFIALGLTAVSTVIGVAGEAQKGDAAKQLAEYNASVADKNALAAVSQAKEQERRSRVDSAMAIGGMKAAYGASGVTTEGSPLDVLQASAANAELDALTIRHAGLVKSIAFQNDAKAFRMGGASAQSLGYLNAMATGAEGAAKLASMYKFKTGASNKISDQESPSYYGSEWN